MTYIKNILLSTDLTMDNTSVIVYTSELAKLLGAKVFLLCTYNIPVTTDIDFIEYGAIEEGIIEDSKERFKHVKENFFYSNSIKYELILKPGDVEDNIENILEDKSIDLLVMGSSGPHGVLELLGSHTSNIVNKVKIPFLVVPENSPFNYFKNILYACDLKRLSSHLDILVTFVNKSRAHLYILTVENKYHSISPSEMITRTIISRLFSDPEIEQHHKEGEDIEKEILDFTDKNNINLLVLTPHQHGLWERITQKSVTRKLLFHAKVPLLILPE